MSSGTDVNSRNQGLEEFLTDLGSDDPTPGGGSAAAVTGALGAALCEMVASLTLDKKKYKDVGTTFRRILNKANSLRNGFLEALDEDIQAYNEVIDAYRLPSDSEEENEKRTKIIQSALKNATVPPLKIAQLAIEVLKLSKECAISGNRNAITDAGTSAILANAAVQSAMFNVDINLSSISDSNFVREKKRKRENFSEIAQKKSEEVVKILEEQV